jgi:hypothetical protein
MFFPILYVSERETTCLSYGNIDLILALILQEHSAVVGYPRAELYPGDCKYL